MPAPQFVPYPDRHLPPLPPDAMLAAFHDVLRRRRSVRMFSDRPVPRSTIEWLVRCAHTAPSGANSRAMMARIVIFIYQLSSSAFATAF